MLPSWMPRKRWVSRRSDRTRGSGSPLLSPPSWTSSRSNHSRSHPQQQHPQQRWWWWWLLFGIASTLTLLWLWIELTASPFSASLSSSFSSSFSWTPTIPSFSTTATTTTTNEPETTTATKATTTQRQPSDRILLRPEDERYMKAMLQRQFDWFRNQASTNSNKNYNSSSNNHTTTTNALFPPPVPWHSSPPLSSSSSSSSSPTACAWLLYGLPRSFATMVLPSLVRNIFLPNAHYHCHVYVSYHALTTPYEPSGRSGHGGPIDSRQVFLLQYAVQQVYEFYWHEWRHTVAAADAAADASSSSSSFTSIPPLPPPPPPPTIQFTSYNDEELWQQHGDLLNKTRYAKDEQGRLLYFPWEPGDFVFPTSADNIIRMWHATQSVWELMRQHEQVLWLQQQSSSSSQQQQQRTNKQSPSSLSSSSYYARVAMLRVDVFFISPIDIWQTGQPPRQRDEDNRVAVVPAFAKFPVNDRLIYGPYRAVELWAAKRFDMIEDHVQAMKGTGLGIHSERFLNYTIFPAIRKLGIAVEEDPGLCFVRARADESLWINDCRRGFRAVTERCAKVVEETLHRKCTFQPLVGKEVHKGVVQLTCDKEKVE